MLLPRMTSQTSKTNLLVFLLQFLENTSFTVLGVQSPFSLVQLSVTASLVSCYRSAFLFCQPKAQLTYFPPDQILTYFSGGLR